MTVDKIFTSTVILSDGEEKNHPMMAALFHPHYGSLSLVLYDALTLKYS